MLCNRVHPESGASAILKPSLHLGSDPLEKEMLANGAIEAYLNNSSETFLLFSCAYVKKSLIHRERKNYVYF